MPGYDDIGIQFKRIDTLIAKRANAQLAQLDITFSQASVLRVLAQSPDGEAAFKHVERTLDVSQPTVAGLIARLREKGLVTTRVSPDNANAKLVALTDAGVRTCEQASRDVAAENERLLAGFTPDERAQLASLLERIVANVGT